MISLLDVSFEHHFITFKVSGSALQNSWTRWAKFTLPLFRDTVGGIKFSQAALSAQGGRNLNHLIIGCFSHLLCISQCLNFSLKIARRRSRDLLPGCACAVSDAYTACLAGGRFYSQPQLPSLSQVPLVEHRAQSSRDRLENLFRGGRLQVRAVPSSLLHSL